MYAGGEFLSLKIDHQPVFSPEAFSDVQREFAQTAEEFARHEILPQKDKLEHLNKDLSLELIKKCGNLGLLAVDVPEKYGGLDAGKVTSAILVEKISAGQSESFTVTFSVQTGIGTLPLVFFGSEQQKSLYLPKIATGEILSSYALTEPEAGSDALSIRTHARLSDDAKFYIINGNKQFISNGGWADLLITFAKIDGEKLTGFLIDPKSPGITLHEEKNKLGLHGSSTCNIALEDVKVPIENMLGQIGRGADIIFSSLNIGRYKLGAAVLGGCKNVIEQAIKYGLERKQFGQSIIHHDAIQKKLADMTIQTFALESIVYETAYCIDKGLSLIPPDNPDYSRSVTQIIENFVIECSACKIYGSETFWKIADEGLQIFGGYGFMEEFPMARILRDTRVDRIYEGTNEINRQVITGHLMKKILLEELPIREKLKEAESTLVNLKSEYKKDLLISEKRALETAKILLIYLFSQALTRFGQDLLNEHQIGELLSDLIMDIFILHCSLSRISQTLPAHEDKTSRLAIARAITTEKIEDILRRSYIIRNGIFSDNDEKTSLHFIRKCETYMHLPFNTFTLKREIVRTVLKQKGYPF